MTHTGHADIRAPRGHVPTATYRLQLHRDFTFRDAIAVLPYLRELGASDCYCSPYLMARPGSRHGYDIIDHTRLNPEVGTEQDYADFVRALQDNRLGQLLDFVPNHMGIDPKANKWWREVLENGQSSIYGGFFDIDWHPVKSELDGKVLLPILGDQYGKVLERGELRLGFSDGALHVDYFEHCLPINPRRAARVYEWHLETLRADLGPDSPEMREFLSILTELKNLPDFRETDPEKIAERHREKEVARDRLARLTERAPRVLDHIEGAVRAFTGDPADPQSFDRLHDLLEEQAYRLAYWRTASHEINYRRFFDINDLAGVRMEDPDVFAATHVLVGRLVREGAVTGLRIDHPDGLYDPAEYFRRVQQMAAPDVPADDRPLYLLTEKILSVDEELPAGWVIHGTTGYNYLNELNGLFVDPAGARPLRRIYRRITRQLSPFDEVVYQCKKLITETSLASELNVLAHALNRISEGNRRSRDFTLNSLREALAEVVACFPVYRTYVNRNGWTASDRKIIETAVRRARQRNAALEVTAWDFLREVLLPRQADSGAAETDANTSVERRVSYAPPDEAEYRQRLHFAMRFQQYTAPVQAKGVEDTAFYRYNLLVSLNEVGGNPGRFGVGVAKFHEQNAARLRQWPLEMTATATHDTKLGEDVRARIDALSELVDDWRRALARWIRINTANRTKVDNEPAPDRNDEYRFYQALLGTWPAEAFAEPEAATAPDPSYVQRLREYMTKASKEAKVRTSWINDNDAYDSAMTRFVERTLAGPTAPRFIHAFLPLARRVAFIGMLNSLSQLVLKIASPGVPDFYQGTELWDLHLVDPDNRGAVDYERRRAVLRLLEPAFAQARTAAQPAVAPVSERLRCWHDGAIKLFLTATGLRLRRDWRDVFLFGDYLPLEFDLDVPADVVGFARRGESGTVLTLAPRLMGRMVDEMESAARAARQEPAATAAGVPASPGGAQSIAPGVATAASSALAVARPDAPPLPIGEAWGRSRMRLPDGLAGSYRNAITGEVVESRDTESGLALSEVFRTCPAAWLVRNG